MTGLQGPQRLFSPLDGLAPCRREAAPARRVAGLLATKAGGRGARREAARSSVEPGGTSAPSLASRNQWNKGRAKHKVMGITGHNLTEGNENGEGGNIGGAGGREAVGFCKLGCSDDAAACQLTGQRWVDQGRGKMSLQRGCQSSSKIKAAASAQQVSSVALGTRQAAGFKPQLSHQVLSLLLHLSTSAPICWLSSRFRSQALLGRERPFAGCCTSLDRTKV